MGTLVAVFLAVSFLEVANVIPIQAASSAQSSSEERQGFQRKVQSELDDLTGKVRDLESKAEKAGSKERKALKQDIKKLKADIKTAESKLDKLKSSSSTAWDHLKTDFEKAEQKARDSYDRLAAKVH